jgi:hypothetical protein
LRVLRVSSVVRHNTPPTRRQERIAVSTHDTARITPKVHTKAEAAVILRVKESWLERRAAARDIPFTMLGGAYHFTDEHLAEIVRINERVPAAGEPKAERIRRAPQKRTQPGASAMPLRPRPRPDGPRRRAA